MRSKPIILVALLLAAFLVNLDTTLVNVALPALVRELHASTTQLQWVVDSFNLVFAALLLTFGSLSDRFGRKGMLLAGLTVFGAASLAGGFTTGPAQLIAARSVMGLGAAMTFPATLSLISNVFTARRERARAIGLWGAVAGVAIAMGPIVGGWLLGHFSWASIFIAMAPVAAAAAVLVALVVPTSKDPDAAALDIAGLVLSSATMALLVFTIIEAPDYGWAAARSVAGFAVSAVLLAAFIVRERRAAHPMLDVRLFRNMRFSAASGAVTVSFFTLLGFIFLMTQYFQFVRGYGPLSTGVRLLPVALSVGAGSVAGTQLAVRAGTKLIVTIGLVAMAVFYGWVAVTTSATLSYGVIAAQMVLYGLGMGLSSAPATESIMGAISRAKAGVGSAVNDSTRLIGGTLGVAVIGSVYASVYGSRLTATLPASVPGRVAAIAHQSVGAAYVAAGKIAALGHPGLGQALQHTAANAFLRGLTISCLVAAGVAAAGALLAVLFLAPPPPPPKKKSPPTAPSQSRSPRQRARRPVKPKHPAAQTKPGPRRVPPRQPGNPLEPPYRIRACETAARPAPQRVAVPPDQHRRKPIVMTGSITRHRDIESLKTAARWPGADRNTTVTLATRLAAARADAEGYRYFSQLAGARPGETLPLTLAGFFQARLGEDRSRPGRFERHARTSSSVL
jgi:EmrB/QacA subfamily drug resistance transporter